MKQVWNKEKWDSESITKIIDMVNSNSLRTIGSGAVRDQWGSYSFSFMSKYDSKKYAHDLVQFMDTEIKCVKSEQRQHMF